jgi:two-component system response regulator TctD
VKLLLVEDNAAMQTTLKRCFERLGWQVALCGDGARALDRWAAAVPDVVVLDLNLPGEDGLSVLAEARRRGLATPVLIVTARGTVGDRILGLDTGADDYLAKPFDLDELEARVRALARRSGAAREAVDAVPGGGHGRTFCGLRADPASGAVYLDGQPMELSAREAALLRALLQRPGQAVAKERLSDTVFADAHGASGDVQPDAIEVVVYRLRRKLAGTSAQLVTLRGLGYLLRAAG